MTCDSLGRLWEVHETTTGGATTCMLYDGDALVAEYGANGTFVRRHVPGPNLGADDPLVSYEGSSVALANARFLHSDARGSIVWTGNSAGAQIALNT